MPARRQPAIEQPKSEDPETATPGSCSPGDGLLRPAALLPIALLLLNDHLLKGRWPGWLTGKLSDVMGMIFFPLLLQALIEWGLAAIGRPWGPSRRVLVGAAVATALVFSLVEVFPPMTEAYRWGLGLLQWPVRALLHDGPTPLLPVEQTADPTDLLTVPFVLLAVATGWARSGR